MVKQQFTSVAELDAAYPHEAYLGYIQELRHLTGPHLFKDAHAEITERVRVSGISKVEAARLVLADYKAGAR